MNKFIYTISAAVSAKSTTTQQARACAELENPADYMAGLTAISKRSIYVGEAKNCLSVRINT